MKNLSYLTTHLSLPSSTGTTRQRSRGLAIPDNSYVTVGPQQAFFSGTMLWCQVSISRSLACYTYV